MPLPHGAAGELDQRYSRSARQGPGPGLAGASLLAAPLSLGTTEVAWPLFSAPFSGPNIGLGLKFTFTYFKIQACFHVHPWLLGSVTHFPGSAPAGPFPCCPPWGDSGHPSHSVISALKLRPRHPQQAPSFDFLLGEKMSFAESFVSCQILLFMWFWSGLRKKEVNALERNPSLCSV